MRSLNQKVINAPFLYLCNEYSGNLMCLNLCFIIFPFDTGATETVHQCLSVLLSREYGHVPEVTKKIILWLRAIL